MGTPPREMRHRPVRVLASGQVHPRYTRRARLLCPGCAALPAPLLTCPAADSGPAAHLPTAAATDCQSSGVLLRRPFSPTRRFCSSTTCPARATGWTACIAIGCPGSAMSASGQHSAVWRPQTTIIPAAIRATRWADYQKSPKDPLPAHSGTAGYPGVRNTFSALKGPECDAPSPFQAERCRLPPHPDGINSHLSRLR